VGCGLSLQIVSALAWKLISKKGFWPKDFFEITDSIDTYRIMQKYAIKLTVADKSCGFESKNKPPTITTAINCL